MPANLLPSRRAFAWLALLLFAGFPRPAFAEGKIGVVLMHGEQGAPGRVIDGLGQALEQAGYLVGRPDMCWSARRGYEAPFEACLATVDDAIVKLRNLGAGSIVVGGFSLGGNAAIAYGADHPGLLGIFALAPAHDANAAAEIPEIAESVARASRLVAEGKGGDSTTLSDIAFGPTGAYVTEVATTPEIYLTFFGPASPADIPGNARRLQAPLLWVAGADDPTQKAGADQAFAHAPANPLNRYVVVAAGHRDTPERAISAVLGWLGEVAKGGK